MAGLKKTLLISLFVSIAVLCGAVLLVQIGKVPSLKSIKKGFRTSHLTILDRQGLVLDEILSKDPVRRLNWVPLDQLPPHLVEAVLKSQRYRFSPNSITMQLARKGFWPSVALEMVWSQKQILEAYVNLSVYRGELQGVAAASQALFDRPPQDLSRAQSAVLASLIHSNGKGVDQVRGKACALLLSLDAGEECGLVSEKHLANVEKSYRLRPFAHLAPHVAQRLARSPELRTENVVHTTLDRQLQWQVMNILQQRNISDGAAVVLDNKTGHVLVYVGNTNGLEGSVGKADLAAASGPAGASLKPFLFAKALDERTLTASTVLSGKNEVSSMRGALLANMNLPAVQALEAVGVESFVQALGHLGFQNLLKPQMYGPSLALGSADVSLLELANAYRALGNRGIWSPIRFSPEGTFSEAARRVFSPGAAFIISDILQDPGSPHPWRAVFCEQICAGYSERYTLALLKGGKETWEEIMALLHRSESSEPPTPPANLHQVAGEWFLEGTIPETEAPPVDMRSRISYPKNMALIELDPKKTQENSRLFFQVVAPQSDQNLYLNGQRLGRAQSLLAWRPESGRYLLELRDAAGNRLDKVQFEVRGLSFAAGQTD